MNVNQNSGYCQFCSQPLVHKMLDLGAMPLANEFNHTRTQENILYPLTAFVCSSCYLVQLDYQVAPTILFNSYPYCSSVATSYLAHAKRYVDNIIAKFNIDARWQIVEVGSNDGYLLQYFVQHQLNCIGIEPAVNLAKLAANKNVATITEYFNAEYAAKFLNRYQAVDLLIINNVMAHSCNLQDFVAAISIVLSDTGIVTIEVPHLLSLLNNNQFDTIYHEHYYYFSLLALQNIFSSQYLEIFDVEQLLSHGGSLRLYVKKIGNKKYLPTAAVDKILAVEKQHQLDTIEVYLRFAAKILSMKTAFVNTITALHNNNCTIVAYGAPAKGNILLCYYGINYQLLSYTVDRNIYKQNLFLPGSKIPVLHPNHLSEDKPDYIVCLPWNLRREILADLQYTRQWGCKFIIPIPSLEIV